MLELIGNVLYFLLWLATPLIAAIRWVARKLGIGRREPGPEPKEEPYWQNVVHNQFTFPREVVRSRSMADLEKVIARGLADGVPVRAVGSGHSFSDVAVTDGYLVDLHRMRKVLVLEPSVLKEGADPGTLFEIEAGIRIRELNGHLDKAGLALKNMGGYDVQTISGAISTATHGSGHALPPLCDAVESMVLVTARGTIRLEPSDGVTDPHRYGSRTPRLVQDDRRFYSAVVAMGSMGIVYSYILRVRPAFLLRESRDLVAWRDVREALKKRAFAAVAHYEVLVNPYAADDDPAGCLITRRIETSEKGRTVDDRERNPIAAKLSGVPSLDHFVLRLFQRFPHLSPRLIESALRGLKDDTYIDKSFRVFNLGRANLVPAISSEPAFDSTTPGDGSDPAFLRAVEAIRRMAHEESARGRWHTSPISLRFVEQTMHYLAPQYGRPTCMIEIPLLDGTPHGFDLLRYYERRLVPLGARPHWGQAQWLGGEWTARTYPRFLDWLAVFEELNPGGSFDNIFTERLGLRAALEKHEAQAARGPTLTPEVSP